MEKCGKKKYITERMEEAPENGKESSHSAHGNGMNELSVTGLCQETLCTCHFCTAVKEMAELRKRKGEG
jgi:hypothetical protein